MSDDHRVKVARTEHDIEMILDNAAFHGWGLAQIVPIQQNGSTIKFWVVLKKGTRDD